MAHLQLCTFRVDDLHFGVDVLHVQEVFQYQELTHVPLAPPSVVGLINLRGQIVTAIDMRRRLQLPAGTKEEDSSMNVVLNQGDSIVSLLVDAIGDVVEVDDGSFEPPPETLDETTKSMVKSICKQQKQLLLVLDANTVVGRGLYDAA